MRPFDDLEREIDVEPGPVEMIHLRPLDRGKLGDRRIAEPREVAERQVVFLPVDEKPQAMLRDVAQLNARSGAAMLREFQPRAP